MEHDGYKLFSFPNPSGKWITVVQKMMQSFPEVSGGVPVSQDGSVEYPSVYYHPTVQTIVLHIAQAVRPCLESVCGAGKTVSYVPGQFVYYTYPNPALSIYRWLKKNCIRRNATSPSSDPGARSFIIYFNMDPLASMSINICAGSHKDDDPAADMQTKVLKKKSPMVDDKGRVYETVSIPPNGVMLLDGRVLEYVNWRVPKQSTGAWMSFVFVVSDLPKPLFGGENVAHLQKQAQPIACMGSEFTSRRSRIAICGRLWLEQNVAPSMKTASKKQDIWLRGKSRTLAFASLTDAGLPLWPISPGFSSLIHGIPIDRIVPDRKRKREAGKKE